MSRTVRQLAMIVFGVQFIIVQGRAKTKPSTKYLFPCRVGMLIIDKTGYACSRAKECVLLVLILKVTRE